MAKNIIGKYFDNFKGLDLRVSDLKREQGAATATTNVTMRKTGALSKRKGKQYTNRTTGGAGLFNFIDYQDDGTNNIVFSEQMITADTNLHRQLTEEFNITYTGSDTAYYDMVLNEADSNFYFDVYDDNARVLNSNVGTGKETSFVTITTLVAAINALTNFTCTTSSTYATEPAAFVPINLNITIPITTGVDISFQAWEQVVTPNGASNPLTDHDAHKDDADFRTLSSTIVNNTMYLSGESLGLMKYDGNRAYKAGITAPTASPSLSATPSGVLTGVYKYKYTFEVYDSNGNIIESDASPVYTSASVTSKSITLTFPTTGTSSGFNTDLGNISATGAANPIPLTAGHEIKPFDYVAVQDNVTGKVTRRKVISTTTTSATVTGGNITMTSGDKVASSISIRIYRTKVGGTLFYDLTEQVNDSSAGTITYTDNTADTALGAIYVEPATTREVALTGCKYSTVWRGIQILSGEYGTPNTVYFSDVESPEYFPLFDNSFDVITKSGKPITGVKSLDNALYVFTEDAITVVTGDLTSGAFVVDTFSDEGVGCRAHATIQEIDNEIWFLSSTGVYSISQKGLVERSAKITPEFSIGSTFNFDQAISFNWIDQRQFVLCMPITLADGSGDQYTADAGTKIFVYDRFWQSWNSWNSFDLSGGMVEYKSAIYLGSRNVDTPSGTVKRHTSKIHDTGLTYDYADHEIAITFQYKTHWETLGEPSMFKKYRRIKVYALDASLDDFESQDFTLSCTVENDYAAVSVSDVVFDFGGSSAGWGNSPWGSFPWGEVRLFSLKHKLNQRKAKSARVTFANTTANENVLISGYELDIAVPYRQEIKE